MDAKYILSSWQDRSMFTRVGMLPCQGQSRANGKWGWM